MKVPTVNKFLCVFDLSLGGLIIGYFIAITYAMYAFFLIFDMFFRENESEVKERTLVLVQDAEQFSPAVQIIEGIVHPTEEIGRDASSITIKVLAVVMILILAACCVLAVWFIQGINERNSRKIKPFLILIACFTGGVFIHGIVSLSTSLIVTAMFHVYLLIVIYSIFQQFEMETCPVQQELHSSASSKGYTQAHGLEAGNPGKEVNGGYQQSSGFEEP